MVILIEVDPHVESRCGHGLLDELAIESRGGGSASTHAEPVGALSGVDVVDPEGVSVGCDGELGRPFVQNSHSQSRGPNGSANKPHPVRIRTSTREPILLATIIVTQTSRVG
ncbi:MAG: hypothetical protein ACFCU2_05520 [Acidimicrobiia bacterium]